MATTPPYGSFQFLALRATKATAVGAPVPGANQGYYTKGVVDAKLSPDIETGEEDTLKRGDGAICATSKTDDITKRAKLDLNLCALDAALISFLTGSLVINDSGVAAGFEILGPDDDTPNPCILEGWTKAWDNSVQASPAVLGSLPAYWHFVFPAYKGNVGDLSLDSKHNAIPITGTSDASAHATINGPYDDWPAYVATYGGITRPYGVFLDTALPSSEGFLTVSGAAS